jgi:hypothetical protein
MQWKTGRSDDEKNGRKASGGKPEASEMLLVQFAPPYGTGFRCDEFAKGGITTRSCSLSCDVCAAGAAIIERS